MDSEEFRKSLTQIDSHELLECAPDAFFQGTPQGDFILVNSNAVTLTGYTKTELLQMNMRQLFSNSELNKKPLRYDLIQNGQTIITEREIVRKDGTLVSIEMSSRQNKDGTIQAFIRDISERVKADRAIKEYQNRFRLAFNTSPDAFSISTVEGVFTDVNDGFCKILGYTREEVVGNSTTGLGLWLSTEHRDVWVQELAKHGTVSNLEIDYRKKDGSIITGLTSATLFEVDGEQRILVSAKDITPRIKLEAELRKSKENAEESNLLKTRFLANLSHEIRTPMNGILGFSELLMDFDMHEDSRIEYLEAINKSGKHLLSVLNDIIDISKIETNQIEPNISQINLIEILDDLEKRFNPELNEKEGLRLNIIKAKPFAISTDETKLQQILSNLVSNAIKFTETGEISVSYKVLKESVEFVVRDTGKGISKEDQDVVFERFRQAAKQPYLDTQGSGLGLSISKAYVEMLGGAITLKSELNKGSEFRFTIRNYASSNESIEDSPRSSLDKTELIGEFRLLVAEDNDDNYKILEAMLKGWGINCIRAKNGKEAVSHFRSSQNKCPFDLVLMDIRMPEMNGIDAAKQIKSVFPNLPVIAQTAAAFQEDESEIRKLDFDDYISKPITAAVLRDRLEYFLVKRK